MQKANHMKKLLFIIFIILSSCAKETDIPLGHEFQIYATMPISNGYYYLTLEDNNWQTLQRISGHVSAVTNDYDLTRVYWSSSHYWVIGDTLGYIVHQNNTLNDNGYLYMNNDTSYVTWFSGTEVPVVNSASYSTMSGEINTMFAPVQSMRGDTVTISAYAIFADGHVSNLNSLKFILE